MKAIRNIFLAFPLFTLITGIFTSCEDVVEVDLGNQTTNLYAVEAKITTENNPYVFLYKSQRVDNDTEYTGISGAHVTVYENGPPGNAFTLKEHPQFKGFYGIPSSLNHRGETEKTYTVEIETNGLILSATEKLQRVEPIDSIQVKPSLRGDSIFLGVFTYGNEPAGQGDFYKWDIYVNDSLLSDAMSLVIASDELVDGNYIDGFEIFTDFHEPDKPENRTLKVGDTIQVKQTSLTPFAYDYYFQMLNQSQTGGLFSVPPANIQGNFTASDGSTVLGLFTAHDVSVSNKIIIDQKLDNQLKN